MRKNKIPHVIAVMVILVFLIGYVPYRGMELPLLGQIKAGGWFRQGLYFCLGLSFTALLCEEKMQCGEIFARENARLFVRGAASAASCSVAERLYFFVVGTREFSGVEMGLDLLFAVLGSGVMTAVLALRTSKEKDCDHSSLRRNFHLDFISTYRSQLMGVAILLVMLFHMKSVQATFGGPLVRKIISCGYAGVDIFMLMSGLGMVFSLSKNQNWANFMKRRLVTVVPAYFAVVGIYSLMMIFAGDCGWEMLVLNLTTLSFYTGGDGAFNWYIPCILLFYLVTPWIYRRLSNPGRRVAWAVGLCLGSYLFSGILGNVFDLGRLNIAFTRFPVYVLGMLTGFAIKEGWTFGWKDRIAMWVGGILFGGLYLLHEGKVVGIFCGHWLLFAPLAFLGCAELAALMKKVPESFVGMRALKWMGDNSLLLFLLNILLIRAAWVICPSLGWQGVWLRRAVGVGIVIVEILAVAGINQVKKRLPARKKFTKAT